MYDWNWSQSTPRTMIKLDPCYVVMQDISAVSNCVYTIEAGDDDVPEGYKSVLMLTSGRLVLCKLTPDEVFAVLQKVNKRKP